MDSCGPSNPVKTLRSALDRESDFYRDSQQQASQQRPQFRAPLSLRHEDAQLARSFLDTSELGQIDAQQQQQQQQRLPGFSPQQPLSNWADQFRSQPAHEQHRRENGSLQRTNQMALPHPPPQTYHIPHQVAVCPPMLPGHLAFNNQLLHVSNTDDESQRLAFEQAFAQVESQLNEQQLTESLQGDNEEDAGIRLAAKRILETTSSAGLVGDTAEKFKSSQFLSFMNKVQSGEAKITDDGAAYEGGSTVSTSYTSTTNEEAGQPSVSVDPFEFIERLARRQSDKIEAFERERYKLESHKPLESHISPLKLAQELADSEIDSSSWESGNIV